MPETDFSKLHCLIVDDDQSFRVLFESMLHRLGIGKVITARSVPDAIGVFRTLNHPVDITFCDFSMENGSGIDLLRAVRTSEVTTANPETCFVMVSASSMPGLVRIAAALDVNGYLVKPFSVNSLKATIEKALQRTVIPDRKRYAEVPNPEC